MFRVTYYDGSNGHFINNHYIGLLFWNQQKKKNFLIPTSKFFFRRNPASNSSIEDLKVKVRHQKSKRKKEKNGRHKTGTKAIEHEFFASMLLSASSFQTTISKFFSAFLIESNPLRTFLLKLKEKKNWKITFSYIAKHFH